MPDGRCGGHTWVLGPLGNRRRLRLGALPVARGCRLGTVGRPGTERLMRLPCRMCPLGGRDLGPGSDGGMMKSCQSLEIVLQSAFVASASNVEGCGSDCQWPNQSRNQPIGDTPRSGSPLWRCGRSSVVFTEGADSSPTDWGSVSEACEIGGLGTLAVALRGGSSARTGRPAVAAAEGRP